LLLEAGAETAGFFPTPHNNKIALCVKHGQTRALRSLLRLGVNGGDANAHIPDNDNDPSSFRTAMHQCLMLPTPEKLECLKVLVKEFGGDVNALDDALCTPLHWLKQQGCNDALPQPGHDAALELLVELGADVEARDEDGDTPIMDYAYTASFESLKRLIGYGAAVDVRNDSGATPLMYACYSQRNLDRKDVILELLQRSSGETQRAVASWGNSTIDYLVSSVRSPFEPWQEHVIAELLRCGTPVKPPQRPPRPPDCGGAVAAARRRAGAARVWQAMGLARA
jgi:ankyrin repeat protein